MPGPRATRGMRVRVDKVTDMLYRLPGLRESVPVLSLAARSPGSVSLLGGLMTICESGGRALAPIGSLRPR